MARGAERLACQVKASLDSKLVAGRDFDPHGPNSTTAIQAGCLYGTPGADYGLTRYRYTRGDAYGDD